MSILQYYEEHAKYLGQKTIDAISEYLNLPDIKKENILYSDIIYKKEEWQKFDNWYKKVYNIEHGESSKRD